jgi:hypothetical protein
MGMIYSSKPAFRDVRTSDASFIARREEERRLCAVIESEQSSTDEVYQALIKLACMSGVLVSDGLAEAA